jgi:16S rRNA C967 or C1407 C5-methylase (RsmB/RsmF family)/NOL1/NOP2/fmu family ribosome biogenesis protein
MHDCTLYPYNYIHTMQLPEAFVERIKHDFGPEAEAFLASLLLSPATSVRLNPHKLSQAWPDADPIQWHPMGKVLPSRPIFATDPIWHAGGYYVQEASSMVLREVLRQAYPRGREQAVCALDFCAAPGGKTTILLDELHPDALVVANEVIQSRVAPLAENLERWGHINTVITSAEVERFAPMAGQFDLVLVDAPCSGEGMFRKDNAAAAEWSLAHVQLCASRQQRILTGIVPLLAPGGVLIYSTCTFNEEENDRQLAWLQTQFGLESIQIELPQSWAFTATQFGYAAYPHLVRGEGFYIAALRKGHGVQPQNQKMNGYKRIQQADKQQFAQASAWLKTQAEIYITKSGGLRMLPAFQPLLGLLEQHMAFCLIGRELGEIKGKDLIPAHALALSLDLADTQSIDLNLEQALTFLRKQDLQLEAQTGWTLIRYQGLGLGWVKVLPNRVNNYLPMERRLRML